MAEYQVVDKEVLDADLKSIGDSIRAKGGTAELFNSAKDMKDAVDAIQTGGGCPPEIEAGYKVYANKAKGVPYNIVDNKIEKIAKSAFSREVYLRSAAFNVAVEVGRGAFSWGDITELILPLCKFVPQDITSFSKKCTIVDLGSAEEIDGVAFKGSGLETLIIRTRSVCVLDNISAFVAAPIAAGTGYIYVPRALVDQYKAATNWVTYATQIRAIEDYPDITGG